MSRRLYGLSGLKLLLPRLLFMGFVRSALLAMAGKEDEARAAMQRYLANDNAPIRTMSQWHARQSENRCRPIIRLFLRVFLYSGRNSTMASEKPDCRSEQRGCPRRRGDRKSGSLHVSCGSIASFCPSTDDFRSTPINGHREAGPVGPFVPWADLQTWIGWKATVVSPKNRLWEERRHVRKVVGRGGRSVGWHV